MKMKRYLITLTLFMVLMCCVSAISAASDDAINDTLSEMDFSDEAISVSNDENTVTEIDSGDEAISSSNGEQAIGVDESKSALDTKGNEYIRNSVDELKYDMPDNQKLLLSENNKEILKTGTKTVEVNDYNELITELNNAVEDSENEIYIINLNEGTYQLQENDWLEFSRNDEGSNIIINGNKQELTVEYGYAYLTFLNCNITLNEIYLKHDMYCYESTITIHDSILDLEPDSYLESDGTLTISNSTINAVIYNWGDLNLDDDVIFGENFNLEGNVPNMNDTSKIAPYLPEYNGDYILENTIISSDKTNYGILTIRNSTINSQINNYGTLIICDDVTFGERFSISGDGEIETNKTIAPYLSEYNGNYILENTIISTYKTNYGILTIRNSTINSQINNYGTLIICDDVTFGDDCCISGSGQIKTNITNKIVPYLSEYNGNYILENITINQFKQNYGNLTIRNSTIIDGGVSNDGNLIITDSIVQVYIQNSGKLIIENTTLNNGIDNPYGTVIFGNDVTFGPDFYIYGGEVIANDYSKLFKYMSEFKYEATVELGEYDKKISNSGNLTIENTTFTYNEYGSDSSVINSGNLIIINSTTNTQLPFSNSGTMEFRNSTINTEIQNDGTLIISEDTIIGENFKITGTGEVLTNNTQVFDYLDIYNGNIVLNNKTITTPKTNKGNLTLNNCTINSTINNDGIIIIDENTVFGENATITGTGKIIIEDIYRILPIIDTIDGYEINDTTLTKTYTFDGEVTLNNCAITNPNNTNFGTLCLNNCTVNVGENSIFINNYGTVNISDDTNIIGKIVNLANNGVYIVTQDTIEYFFDETGLTSFVNPGDTLNIQGTIELNQSLIINKPVNLISTTNDAYIDLNTTAGSYFGENPGNSFVINKYGSDSNVTGINFHNTQIWLFNTNHVVLDNISNVIEDRRIGSGVGATSIRANSTYVTVKNSYFYTRNNGGSSSLVMAWADYCTFDNNTVVVEGEVGNMIYLTTFNVNIPSGIIANVHNNITNNKIYSPNDPQGICWGLVISGNNNLIENNTVDYKGVGITNQWSTSASPNNTYRNNLILQGGSMSVLPQSVVYNNNVSGDLFINSDCVAYNNSVGGEVSIEGANAVFENNTIVGDVIIGDAATNTTFIGNNVNSTVNVYSNDNIIKDNNIVTVDSYAVDLNSATGNNVTDNYLIASELKGDAAVKSGSDTNIIKDNLPVNLITTILTGANLEMIYKDGNAWTAQLTDATGNPIANVIVKVGIVGKVYSLKTNDEGIVGLPINLAPGTYEVNATYEGDGQYADAFINATITVNKIAYTLSAENLVMAYKDGSSWNVALTDGEGNPVAGVKIAVGISGKIYYIKTDDAGVAGIAINVQPGTYDINASFTSNKYEAETITATITVNKAVPTLSAEDLVMNYKDGSAWNVTLKDAAGNVMANSIVKITTKGTTYNIKTDTNGVASLPINMAAGNYSISARFEGSKYLESVEINSTIVVNPPEYNLVASDINMTYQDGTNYTVQITDNEGNPVAQAGVVIKVTINGKSYNCKTNADGIASLPINLKAGTYEITAEYNGKQVNSTVIVNKA